MTYSSRWRYPPKQSRPEDPRRHLTRQHACQASRHKRATNRRPLGSAEGDCGGMVRASTERRRRVLLRAAQAYVNRSYAELDLTLDDVAEAVGTSPRQLQRVFAEYAGEDFRSYLLRVRMRHAHRLLSREPNPLPVRLVAPRVGYRQASGLRQAFVRFYGHNPSAIQPPPVEYLGNTTSTASTSG